MQRILSKEEFREKMLLAQKKRKKQKFKKSILPFKEETALDIINLLRNNYPNINIIKNNDIIIKIDNDSFKIKIIAKRKRVIL
jgi:short-subunit dehydrogenase involved in D-alanine esterification of teichoic acids